MYKVDKLQTVIKCNSVIADTCSAVHEKWFQHKDSTWTYDKYNIFSAASPVPQFHSFYKEFKFKIQEWLPNEKRLWFQAWLNYHEQDKVLDWHNHYWPYHGYICIDPKDTVTEFKDKTGEATVPAEWEIKNEVGQIYFGPGHKEHRVVVKSDYTGPRITIGFDIVNESNKDVFNSWSFFPLV